MADAEEVMPTMLDPTPLDPTPLDPTPLDPTADPALAPLDRHASFATLFDAHYPAVLAYCRRRAAPEEAGDAALATFETLWRAMDDPPGAPLPWLYRVAAGQLANTRRSDRRRRRLLDRLTGRAGASEASSPDPADTTTAAASARIALARLRPDDRELLLLVAWEGLSPEEAAAVVGVSPATLAVRLHRARRRLEELLTDPSPPAAKDAP